MSKEQEVSFRLKEYQGTLFLPLRFFFFFLAFFCLFFPLGFQNFR